MLDEEDLLDEEIRNAVQKGDEDDDEEEESTGRDVDGKDEEMEASTRQFVVPYTT